MNLFYFCCCGYSPRCAADPVMGLLIHRQMHLWKRNKYCYGSLSIMLLIRLSYCGSPWVSKRVSMALKVWLPGVGYINYMTVHNKEVFHYLNSPWCLR